MWRQRIRSNGRPGETRRRLKICLRSGQETQDSEILGGCCATVRVIIKRKEDL